MREVEIKVLNIDKDAMIEKLASLGADKILDSDIESIYYDFNRPRNVSLLRIRTDEAHTFVTIKEDRGHDTYKVKEETEFDIEDRASFERTLILLGCRKVAQHKRHRTSFRLKGFRVEIEDIPGIPPFAEIECQREEDMPDALALLGISAEQTSTDNAISLMRKHGLEFFNVR
ncbi:MAG: class IV adenylate cyclase [Nanoarchaeota archaeon]